MFHLFPEYEIGQSITIWEWSTTRRLKILNITSVPCYCCQTAAIGECTVSNSRHGITYDKVFQ